MQKQHTNTSVLKSTYNTFVKEMAPASLTLKHDNIWACKYSHEHTGTGCVIGNLLTAEQASWLDEIGIMAINVIPDFLPNMYNNLPFENVSIGLLSALQRWHDNILTRPLIVKDNEGCFTPCALNQHQRLSELIRYVEEESEDFDWHENEYFKSLQRKLKNSDDQEKQTKD